MVDRQTGERYGPPQLFLPRKRAPSDRRLGNIQCQSGISTRAFLMLWQLRVLAAGVLSLRAVRRDKGRPRFASSEHLEGTEHVPRDPPAEKPVEEEEINQGSKVEALRYFVQNHSSGD